MTENEIQSEMNILRKVFSTVRLLSEDDVGGRVKTCEDKRIEGDCYAVWQRRSPCKNCISYRALTEKKQFSKIEKLKSGTYQVIADYREVDGNPCVLEMIKTFDENTAIDYGDEENKDVLPLSEYFDKTYKDVLTETYNRRYYEEYVADNVLGGGVAMLDLDDFKIYNDLFGHSVGDAVLKAVVATIKSHIRSTDRLIRYGGDEFLLIVPDIKEIAFKKWLRGVVQSVRETTVEEYPSIKPSISVGGVVCDGESVEEAVKRADEFMYIAKKKKDCVITDNSEHGDFKKTSPEKELVLIVDDSPINRQILSGILKSEYDVEEADGGRAAIEKIEGYKSNIAVILLDLVMPEVSGFDVLDYMNAYGLISNIPVVTITGDDTGDSVRIAYEKGVSDYITRPFDARNVYRRVANTIKVYSRQRRLISEITRQTKEKERSRSMMLEILSQIIERPSGGEEGSHTTRITEFTRLILERLICKNNPYGFTGSDVSTIAYAAAMHDMGKSRIDPEIVNKKGKLTSEEYETMKNHTVYGSEMLEKIKSYADEPLVKYAREICLCHHERYDGNGYPNGLKGDEIPVSAQVVSICDVYDALVSKRPYKPAYTHERAIEMIKNGECGSFNPLILECFYERADDFKKITERGKTIDE